MQLQQFSCKSNYSGIYLLLLNLFTVQASREVASCRAGWLLNRTISSLQVQHRISCGVEEADPALSALLCYWDISQGSARETFLTRQMKRDGVWAPSGRRSDRGLDTKCHGPGEVPPNTCPMEVASTSQRLDNI